MDKTHNNTKFVCDKGGLLYVLGTMKNIDIKSLIIGALLTSPIFLGVAAATNNAPLARSTQKVIIVGIDEGPGRWESLPVKITNK